MRGLIDFLLRLIGLQTDDAFHPMLSLVILVIIFISGYFIIQLLMHLLFYKPLKVQNKHCLVTGGSKGLGKCLAIQLAQLGANVTIIARNMTDLEKAQRDIMEKRKSQIQRIHIIQCDVTNREKAKEAILKAKSLQGQAPEFIFSCAGQSMPGMFLQQDLDDYKKSMELNYFGTLNIVQPAAQLMIEDGIQGKIVMVASVLGLFGLIGYSSYVPTKFAMRGLAECLSQELKVYGISVHIMFPGTIFTPGYQEEQKRKPEITKEIEGADGQTPEQIADALIKGVENGQLFITSDIIGELARAVGKGVVGPNGFLSDALLAALGWIIFPFWSLYVDFLIKKSHESTKKTQ